MKFFEKMLKAFGLEVEEVPEPETLVTNQKVFQAITDHEAEKKKKPYTGPGMKIKELRQERGWYQNNLATMAGCTRRQISSIETGEAVAVDYQLAKRIAASLEVDVNYLWPKYSNK